MLAAAAVREPAARAALEAADELGVAGSERVARAAARRNPGPPDQPPVLVLGTRHGGARLLWNLET